MPFVALQGRPLQSATIGYAITPNSVRPLKKLICARHWVDKWARCCYGMYCKWFMAWPPHVVSSTKRNPMAR